MGKRDDVTSVCQYVSACLRVRACVHVCVLMMWKFVFVVVCELEASAVSEEQTD